MEADGLRPTPDRVRETLFNWLQPVVPGSRCLDLFAGTGALGFEALSRDAAFVQFVDENPRITDQIRDVTGKLGANAATTTATSAAWLRENHERFDIIFLDPPFGRHLLAGTLRLIDETRCLSGDGIIYLEYEKGQDLPEGIRTYRQKSAGDVQFGLYTLT